MSSSPHRFDKFTERARKVLSLSQEESQRLQHNYIDTAHLLLGLIRENGGVAARILHDTAGLDLETTRREIEAVLPRGDQSASEEIGLTLRAKRTVELAVDEARRLNHHYIGTEHLLLGLLREGQNISATILENRGMTLEKARTQVLQILDQPGPSAITNPESQTTKQSGEALSTPTQTRTAREHTKEANMSWEEQYLSRLTAQGQAVLDLAREEALRFQHNYIGTEHLLLGLVRAEESVAAQVLARLGVALTKVRSAVEFIIGRGDRVVLSEIGLTPRAKKVVELSINEAARLNQPLTSPEHLLLGLIREGEGIAAGVLTSLGVNLQQAREQTLALISTGTQESISTPVQSIPTMLETYHITDDAKKVLDLAQDEAHLLHHDHVGPEHLLLGLLHEDQHSAATILQSFNIDLARARSAVESQSGQGQHTSTGPLPLTPLAWAYLYLAADESNKLGHHQLDTAHLLLGLTRESQGTIPTLLASLGTTVEAVRTKTFETLQQQSK